MELFISQFLLLTGDFLLIIIIVTGGEELSKDESGHIDFLHLVLYYWNALSIIPYTYAVVLTKIKTQSTYIRTSSCTSVILRRAVKLYINFGLQAKGPETFIVDVILNITHASMLTLMQDMLLSLCLLSAAFTEEK